VEQINPLLDLQRNYATDNEARRSVNGGIHMVGGTIINWMYKTQASVTLLST
jgi:hypothetical protein